jgi:hypothetical protein
MRAAGWPAFTSGAEVDQRLEQAAVGGIDVIVVAADLGEAGDVGAGTGLLQQPDMGQYAAHAVLGHLERRGVTRPPPPSSVPMEVTPWRADAEVKVRPPPCGAGRIGSSPGRRKLSACR